MKFTGIGEKGFIGMLDKDMTIDELVSLIARNTHRTADEIEEVLLNCVNSMFMTKAELVDSVASILGDMFKDADIDKDSDERA